MKKHKLETKATEFFRKRGIWMACVSGFFTIHSTEQPKRTFYSRMEKAVGRKIR